VWWHVLAAASGGGGGISGDTILVWVGIASFLLTAAGIVGMGFRVGSNTQTVKNYRDTAQSYKERADAQEVQISSLQAALANKDHQIAELQAKMEVLERLVLGESTAKALRADHAGLARKMEQAYAELQEVGRGMSTLLERTAP